MFRSMGWYRRPDCWAACSISTSLPAMPRSAAPYCTYVGTSEARTMIRRRPGSLVGRISLRELSGFSGTSMPASASSGMVSSKMRPLDRASVRGAAAGFMPFPCQLRVECSRPGRAV
ncbi:Uncharacterised protein [Bordetella pertussis]|nr:Uncharacterised protein [Bordetella pertussis]